MSSTLPITILASLLAATLNPLGQPAIQEELANHSVSLGASATFQVLATSTAPPIQYQWRLETLNLQGATNASLTLTNIQLVHAGSYVVVVMDQSGSVTSRV